MCQTEFAVSATCEKARICINVATTKENLIIITLTFLNIKNGVNHFGLALWTMLFLKIKPIQIPPTTEIF